MSYVTVGVWPARFCKSILENRVMTAGKCLAVLFSFVFCLSGCSSGPNDPITVSISPRTAYVGSGQSMQFTATVTNSSAGVTWTLTGSDRAFTEGVASGDTIDTGGNFTAPTVTQNSTVTITATSITDPTKSGSVGVTIVAPGVVTATANAQFPLLREGARFPFWSPVCWVILLIICAPFSSPPGPRPACLPT